MENYYVRILTKNMRNVYVEAHRRAMKEYYPPHLTGPGSRGVGLLDMVFFALGHSPLFLNNEKAFYL